MRSLDHPSIIKMLDFIETNEVRLVCVYIFSTKIITSITFLSWNYVKVVNSFIKSFVLPTSVKTLHVIVLNKSQKAFSTCMKKKELFTGNKTVILYIKDESMYILSVEISNQKTCCLYP